MRLDQQGNQISTQASGSQAIVLVSTPAGGRGGAYLLTIEVVAGVAALVGLLFYRQTHPDIIDWGQKLLDPLLGGLIALVTLVGTIAAMGAVRALERGWRGPGVASLLVCLVAGIGVLVCFGVDYQIKWQHNLLPGSGYHPTHKYLIATLHRQVVVPGDRATKPLVAAMSAPAEAPQAPDPARGRTLFLETCAACHGANAQGLPHQGAVLRTSKFVAEQSDDQLLAFIKAGRQPGDPKSVLGLAMPARGGNPALNDAKLRDIITFLRRLQQEAKSGASAASGNAATPDVQEPAPLVVPKSLIADATTSSAGLDRLHPRELSPLDAVTPPAHASEFFSLYFLFMGLQVALVTIGVVAVISLLWRVARTGSAGGAFAGYQWCLAFGTWLCTYLLLYLAGT